MVDSDDPSWPADAHKTRARILRESLKGASKKKTLERRIFTVLYARAAGGESEPVPQRQLAPLVGLGTTTQELLRLRQAATALRASIQRDFQTHHDTRTVFEMPIGEYRLVAFQKQAECEVREQDPSDAPEEYSWDDILQGAKNVAGEIFDRDGFYADAVLTFGGPAQVFAGLVLAALRPEGSGIRVPVYTAIFVDPYAVVPEGFTWCMTQAGRPEKRFKILVPEALTRTAGGGLRKIAVIDDTIISGVTMNALRQHFAELELERLAGNRIVEQEGRDSITFACCVCYEGRTASDQIAPDVIGLPEKLARRLRFKLPWRGWSFSYEDVYLAEPNAE